MPTHWPLHIGTHSQIVNILVVSLLLLGDMLALHCSYNSESVVPFADFLLATVTVELPEHVRGQLLVERALQLRVVRPVLLDC